MGVSENCSTPKSSILIGCSIINHPFWGTPIFGNTHIFILKEQVCFQVVPKTLAKTTEEKLRSDHPASWFSRVFEAKIVTWRIIPGLVSAY